MEDSRKTTGDGFRNLLVSVLSRPTAPFRESWVAATLRLECHKRGIPLFEDSVGNLWAGVRNAAEVKRARLVFVAHMDHPGFVVTGFRRGRKKGVNLADAKWLGGGPMNMKALKGHNIKLFSHFHGLLTFDGVIKDGKMGTRGLDTATLEIHSAPWTDDVLTPQGFKKLGPWGACLWYEPGPVHFSGTRLRTKAADDLAGVCALVDALHRSHNPKGVACLFSRAEESGFHGTIDVLEKRLLSPSQTVMVSVETSAQLPGATLGGGPIVRLGDRATVFHPAAVRWVQDHAVKLAGGAVAGQAPKGDAFAYQRRVMDGGSCEASAFNAYGYTVAGISIPLGGYHNVGPESVPVLEEVDLGDVTRAAALLTALMSDVKNLPADAAVKPSRFHLGAFAGFRKAIVDGYREHRKYF